MNPLVERTKQELASNPTLGRGQLAALLGISKDKARHLLSRARVAQSDLPNSQPDRLSEIVEESKDEKQITINRTRIKTLDELVELCQINLNTWEVERFVVNKWEVGAKNSEGGITVEPLYQVKAWLKKKIKVIAARADIEALLAELGSKAPVYPPIKRAEVPEGNMLEISIPDLHLSRLCWSRETGGANYDTKIAEKVFREAFSDLIQSTSHHKFERICLVVGNDLLNADNASGTTTKGTPQSTDTRYPKTFQVAERINIWAIEQARLIAPVDVIMMSGNHDMNSVFCLGEVLAAWFRNCSDVKVDNEPLSRKFYSFGEVAIMFLHGDKGKMQDYPLLMATEARKLWGNAKYCEIHTADKHQVRLEERHGVRVRTLPALCPADFWSAQNFYTGNVRSAEAYVWNKEKGLIATATHTIQE